MEIPRIPRTGLGLRDIFSQAYRAQPQHYARGQDLTPVESMLLRSQGIDLARQYLPSWAGGYSAARNRDFDYRRNDDDFRARTMRVGEYPDEVDPKRSGVAAEVARRAAQGAGALAADVTTQGAQNLWWFMNAFQAASMAAGQQAMHGALGPNKMFRRPGVEGAPTGSPFTRSNYAVGATFPVILGASAAIGNLFRQPGYAAALPSEGDRRDSENPLLEAPLRAIGMTGRLLPFDDFSRERPDVSRGEYEAYKAYLFGSPMPLKFNTDGIHGAEVNLLGRSLPLLTGVLPVAAGVAGGAVGLRMAGKRLAKSKSGNQFRDLSTKQHEVARIKSVLNNPETKGADRDQAEIDLEDAKTAQMKQLNRVEDALLLGALGGSSAGLSVTAAGAQLLEQVRRAQNMEENRRREAELAAVETEQLPPA
jgi:hypothetical protein